MCFYVKSVTNTNGPANESWEGGPSASKEKRRETNNSNRPPPSRIANAASMVDPFCFRLGGGGQGGKLIERKLMVGENVDGLGVGLLGSMELRDIRVLVLQYFVPHAQTACSCRPTQVTITHDGRFCAICGHPGQSFSFSSIYLDATNAHSRPNTEADRHSVGERAWGFTLWPISRRDTNGGYCLHGGQPCLALSQPWSKGRSSHGIPASEAVIVMIQSKGVAHRWVWGVWEGVSLRR